MVNNQVFIICVWFLLAAFTVQQESAEGSESGTKWMLDECAGAFMRARLRAHDVLHQMEMTQFLSILFLFYVQEHFEDQIFVAWISQVDVLHTLVLVERVGLVSEFPL